MKRRLTLTLLLLAAGIMTAYAARAPRLPKGCTIYGTVTCDGEAMQGVVVSDGRAIAITDTKGRYFINSDKRNGTVFVSIPSCTEVPCEYGMPHFWEPLGTDATPEEHNFTLTARENNEHAVIAISDVHLANVFDDQEQFDGIFMPRLREEVEKYRSRGIPVYCINAGDSSYDRYWFEDMYTIDDFVATMKYNDFPVPMFPTMGNHDNDGSTSFSAETDFNASARYRRAMGPTHYSFNIGKVHYIMLDNVVYLNSPGRIDSYEGITGRRDYEVYVTDDQLEWLRRDLETISDRSTPVVVTMHVPTMTYKGKGIVTKFKCTATGAEAKMKEFTAIFKDFEQVHFITGHTHKNLTCHGADDTSTYPDIANIIDHNITGVCGCWWQTRAHAGLSLSTDSAPSGFEVFPVSGKSLEWYFVSNDDGADHQFRVFDMNSVRDYYTHNGEMRSFIKQYPLRTDYSKIEDNMIYVHVWAWEPGWKISVTENGRPLEVNAKSIENPQYTISYHLPRASWDDNGTERWQDRYNKPSRTDHFFVARASSPTSTIVVTVTDGFGHSWTETVGRPKRFSKLMR